jgi:serine/threonine-protein kinase RIO1
LENNNTDIALIKRDIKQIEKFFAKVELAMESLQDMSKTAAVQDETLKNTKEHLESLDDLMERHRKDDEKRAELIATRL